MEDSIKYSVEDLDNIYTKGLALDCGTLQRFKHLYVKTSSVPKDFLNFLLENYPILLDEDSGKPDLSFSEDALVFLPPLGFWTQDIDSAEYFYKEVSADVLFEVTKYTPTTSVLGGDDHTTLTETLQGMTKIDEKLYCEKYTKSEPIINVLGKALIKEGYIYKPNGVDKEDIDPSRWYGAIEQVWEAMGFNGNLISVYGFYDEEGEDCCQRIGEDGLYWKDDEWYVIGL